MDKYDFYRTDLLDESEEMVRHRTAAEKNRLKEQMVSHLVNQD